MWFGEAQWRGPRILFYFGFLGSNGTAAAISSPDVSERFGNPIFFKYPCQTYDLFVANLNQKNKVPLCTVAGQGRGVVPVLFSSSRYHISHVKLPLDCNKCCGMTELCRDKLTTSFGPLTIRSGIDWLPTANTLLQP